MFKQVLQFSRVLQCSRAHIRISLILKVLLLELLRLVFKETVREKSSSLLFFWFERCTFFLAQQGYPQQVGGPQGGPQQAYRKLKKK